MKGGGVRGRYQRYGNSTVRQPTEKEYLGAKPVMGRITEDGRRKNGKCMNWYENMEGGKWRMELGRYSRRRFYQEKMHLEKETRSSLQNTFFISICFYFLRKTTKQNEKKKAFKRHGCLTECLGHYVKKIPCPCKGIWRNLKGAYIV